MDLFLNYNAYKTVEDKFIKLAQANAVWELENQEAINKVKNNNQGNWLNTFNASTDDIYRVFLEYADKVTKTNQTFAEADHYVFYLFNKCVVMTWALDGGLNPNVMGNEMTEDAAADIMYNSAHHDTVCSCCTDIDDKSTEEETPLGEIEELMKGLVHADKTILDEDISDMRKGIKKQRNVMVFLEVFSDYVSKVNDFNTNIGSKFAEIVGVFSDFPTFIRNTDYDAYVDSHYAQIDGTDIKDSPLYDNYGQYGGNQGDAIYNQTGRYNIFGDHVEYNEELYQFVREHPGYENYTDEQIAELFDKFNNQGCAYVAACNAIMAEYADKPEEFKEKYGFDLYDENNELNYNMLYIDYSIYAEGVVFTDNVEAEQAYTNAMVGYYREHPEEFEEKYNIKFFEDGSDKKMSQEAANKIAQEYAEASKDGGTVEVPQNWTDQSNQRNRFDAYLEAHGDEATCYEGGSPKFLDMEKFNEMTEQGYTIIVSGDQFNMYNEDGTRTNDAPVGGHAMVVTGVTGDGRLIVSSWGKEYYLNPEESGLYGIQYYKVN